MFATYLLPQAECMCRLHHLKWKSDFCIRMDGIKAIVKAIMTTPNIPIVEERNTTNVERPSSFEQRQPSPNMDSMAPDQSTGKNMITSQRLGGL